MPSLPVPRTWATNEDVTSANMVSGITAVLAFLMNRPRALLRQNSAQSFVTAAITPVQFNLEDVDTDVDGIGGHDNVTNNSRYTARYPGRYLIGGGVGFVANGTGDRYCWLRVNGTDVNGSMDFKAGDATAVTVVACRPISVYLNGAGDYVELIGYQDSGGPLTASATTREQPSMNVLWIGPT